MSDVQKTDSCGYEEERFDESGLARQTAELLGRESQRCVITPEEYFGIVPDVMYNMEQPLGDASAIVFALGCRETASIQRSVIPEKVRMNSSVDTICIEMQNATARI